MVLNSIAILLSVIAIFMCMVVLFISNNGQQQAKEATETTDKINSVLARVETVESKLVEADNEGKAERTERGLLELKKALLSFQEARSLIKDDDLMNKIVKIENEMKSLIILPKPTDLENTESVVLPELSDIGTEPEFGIESDSEELGAEATAEVADVEASIEESSETISLTAESEASQESESDDAPIMEVEITAEGETSGIENSASAVNAENLRH